MWHRCLARMLPRSAGSRLCLFLLLAVALLLVLLQSLELPYVRKQQLDSMMGDDGNSSSSSPLMLPFQGPVPSICSGADSLCLTGLLLADARRGESNSAPLGHRIPAILHLLAPSASGEKPPIGRLSGFLFDWHRLHRNWTYVLWTDQDVQHLVRVAYRRYLSMLESSSSNSLVLAHLAPLLVLQKFGGVIASPDHRPVRSVDALRRLPAVVGVTGRWPRVSAAVAASPGGPPVLLAAPGHPFVQFCTDRALHHQSARHGGLTPLLLDYAKAFAHTDKPEHSLHLLQLDAQPAEMTTATEAPSGGSDDDRLGRLRLWQKKCDGLAGRQQQQQDGDWRLKWLPGIGCSELRELRYFLRDGGAVLASEKPVRSGTSVGEANSLDNDSSGTTSGTAVVTIKSDQLASVFPFLNVGLRSLWKRF